jgi:hypothetical protein
MKIPDIELGMTLWYLIRGRGYHRPNYPGDLIVPVTVDEIDDVYHHPDDPKLGPCWRYRRLDGADYVSVPIPNHEDRFMWEYKDPSWLGNAKPVNRFVWIDEPVGHALQVCDVDDGLFFTLEEAMKYAYPSKTTDQKILLKRLEAYRKEAEACIAKSWEMSGAKHPGFRSHPPKTVYVRNKNETEEKDAEK